MTSPRLPYSLASLVGKFLKRQSFFAYSKANLGSFCRNLLASLLFVAAFALFFGRAESASAKTVSRTQKQKANQVEADAKLVALLVAKINIVGQKKIEKDAIVARLKTREGASYSEALVREDLQSLFKSGYFFDVQVSREIKDGKVELSYLVLEKPSVAEITFEGNSEIKSEELQEALGVKQYEILNMTKLREGIEKLQKMYEDKGFFLAKIEYKIEDVKKDETVKISFSIK